MKTTARRILPGLCMALFAFTLLATAQQKMPQTTKESIPGASHIKMDHLNGTVIQVEGNHLAVRMSTGGVRTFDVPDSRRFIVDGRELTVGELKPGTKLTATVTTTTTSVTDRTTTVGSGKVWWVNGNTVILTLPNNENRMYKVAESYRFIVDGQKASVHDLRKGMNISAEKIVEEPRVEIASNTVVTGEAPPPPKVTVADSTPRVHVEPRPKPAEAAAPAAPPVAAAEAERAVETPAEKLPATASELPLLAMLGAMSIGAGLLARKLRRG